jgi:hypothetical protein
MWTHVSDKGRDTKWLAKELEAGTTVILFNGLYSRKKGPHICRVGWVIACCKARHVVKGSFYEFLRDASSYRGELLGLVATHNLILHTARH